MEYSTLGSSGLHISRLCLGAMTFGAGTGVWGEMAGARIPDQLTANLDAQHIALNAAQTERLNQVSQPHLLYPYWMQQFHDKDRVVV